MEVDKTIVSLNGNSNILKFVYNFVYTLCTTILSILDPNG